MKQAAVRRALGQAWLLSLVLTARAFGDGGVHPSDAGARVADAGSRRADGRAVDAGGEAGVRSADAGAPITQAKTTIDGGAWLADGGLRSADGGVLSKSDPGWKTAYLTARAGDAWAKGKFDEAATLFRSVLKSDPSDETALRHLGAHALKKNDLPLAVRMLEQGVAAHPTSFPLQHELGAVLLRLNRPADAAPHFRAAAALSPSSADSLVNLGDALKASGALQPALEAYRAALQREPTSGWALRQFGYALFDAQAYAEAVPRLTEASRTFPKETSLFLVLGHAALKNDQAPVAQRAYEQVVKLSPQSSDGHLFLGLAHEKQRGFPSAIIAYLKAIDLAPQNPIPKVHLGNVYRVVGDVPRARAAYQKAGLHPWALVQLGFLELEAGRDDEAEKVLKKAQKVAPENSDVGEALGDLAQKNQNWAKAEQEYRTVLKRDKRHLGSRVKLGDVLRILGRVDDAVDAYRLAAAQHPKSVWAHIAFGDGWRAKGELEQALQHYRTAADLDPSSAWARRQLGLALFDAGDDRHAEEALAGLPAEVRAESDVQLTLGHLARRAKKLDVAKGHYEAAIAANSKNAGAFLALADWFREADQLGEALGSARKGTELAQDALPDGWTLRGDLASLILDAEAKPNPQLELEATTSYERAIRLAPKNDHPRRQLGFFCFNRRQDARATELLTQVMKNQADDVELPLTLGHLEVRAKRLTQALELYTRARSLAPDDPRPRGFLGQTLRALDRLPESRAVLEEAVALREDSAWLQLELGYTHFALRDSRRALVAAERSVVLDDANPEAWLFLSRMRQRRALFPQSLEAAERAVLLAPKHALAHRALAAALLDRAEPGDTARALGVLEPFVAELEREALTFLIQGHLLARLSLAPGEDLPRGRAAQVKAPGQQAQEKRRAIDAFDKALALASADEPTRLSVGQGLVDLQETTSARTTLEPLVANELNLCPKDEFALQWDPQRTVPTELVAQSPEETARLERRAMLSRAHLLLGELHEREQRSKEARFEYACAISLAPDTAEAHLKLALAYENGGLIRLAEEHSVAALQLAPNLKPAREAVERLRREAGFPAGPLRLAAEASFTSEPLPLEIASNVVKVTGIDPAERERLLTVPRVLRLGAAAAYRPEDRPDLPRFELQYDALFGFGTFLTDRLQFENTLSHAGTLKSTGRVQLVNLNRAELNWRAGYRLLGGAAPSRTELRNTFFAGARLIELTWGAFDGQVDYEHGEFRPLGGVELVERFSNAISAELRYFPRLKWRRVEGVVGYRGRGVFLGSGRSWGSHRLDVDGLWRGDVFLAGGELSGGVGVDRFPTPGPNVAAGSVGLMAKGGVGLSGYTFAVAKSGFTLVPTDAAFHAARFSVEGQHRFFFRKGDLSLAVSAGYELRWLFNANHVDHLFFALVTFGR
jgi:tetratricopeptide (TPR) repeat protein